MKLSDPKECPDQVRGRPRRKETNLSLSCRGKWARLANEGERKNEGNGENERACERERGRMKPSESDKKKVRGGGSGGVKTERYKEVERLKKQVEPERKKERERMTGNTD